MEILWGYLMGISYGTFSCEFQMGWAGKAGKAGLGWAKPCWAGLARAGMGWHGMSWAFKVQLKIPIRYPHKKSPYETPIRNPHNESP